MGFGGGYTAKEFIQPPSKVLASPVHSSSPVSENSVAVCFTPSKRCQSKIIDEINAARKSIYVQAYSFTDMDIAHTLVKAAMRGVAVKVLLDKSNRNDERSAKNILLYQKIPLRFDAPSGIAHNKIMIIDEAKVISGSYNFSAAAYKRNTENLLVIHNPALAQTYIQNWHARWQVSK
jgi:phosphatidylserine/phosphatidylglycerophosphate/cardiolipin synthase-like enzyme